MMNIVCVNMLRFATVLSLNVSFSLICISAGGGAQDVENRKLLDDQVPPPSLPY